MRTVEGLEEKLLIECLEYLGRGQSPCYVDDDSGVFAINQKCVRNSSVTTEYAKPHDQKVRVKETALLEDGDICINSTGTGTIGRVGLWASRGLSDVTRYFADSHVTIARPNTEVVNPKYLSALLESAPIQTAMETFCFSGSTNQVELNRTALEGLPVKLIRLEEQNTVATILSTLDRAIEQIEEIIAKQQRIKTGLMQDLLTKGIDELGVIRSEATHEFKDSPLGRIPVEWEVAPMVKYGAKNRPYLRTGPFGSALNTKHWVAEGVPVFTIGSLGEGVVLENELLYVSEQTASLLNNYRVERGDIVFSRVADVGRALVVSEQQVGWIISSNFMRISLDLSAARPLFLYRNIAFNSAIHSQLRTASNAGGRDLVNGGILSGLIFPWPHLEEQDRINNAVASIDATINVAKAQLANFQSTKAGLMHDLLTGAVRVANP